MISDPNHQKEKIKVVASALIKNQDGKYLAIRVKDTDETTIYIPPGGRLSEKETLRECVIRETKEEVGIDIIVTSLAGILEKEYEDGIWTFIYYSAKIKGGTVENKESEEISEIDWKRPDEIDAFPNILWVD